MIKLKNIIFEILDNPYKYKHQFSTEIVDDEDEETGKTYKKEILCPVQIIHFLTEKGIPYLWYAKQSRYDNTTWEIAFGIEKSKDSRGTHHLDIGITKTGDVFRIFSTIIDITNSFIECDDNYNEILRLILTSEGDKRTQLYINKIIPRIEKFKLESKHTIGNETTITLIRYE